MSIFSILHHFLGIAAVMFSLHPIHVSVTEIEYDEKEKALEIMMRVFIDDLELTLRKDLNEPELDIIEPKNGKTTDQIIEQYLKNHFKITLDSKAQTMRYLGHEQEGDAFICYIEVSGVKGFKNIQIQNDIITETHEDQSNLVHVTVRGDVKSLRLTRDTPADKLTFNSQ
jgi:hypothetical protein